MNDELEHFVYDEECSSLSTAVIVTHDGIFHGDEVLAIAALRVMGNNDPILRTRNLSDPHIDEGRSVFVDVGGAYSASLDRFDHHQRGGAGVRETGCNVGIPYASAGLVWRTHGVRAVRRNYPDLTNTQATAVAQLVDDLLVAGVDARDTGWVNPDRSGSCPDKAVALSFSSIISSLNPTWVEEATNVEEAFEIALRGAIVVLRRTMATAVAQVLAESVIEEAFENASHGIMEVPTGCPWAQHLHELDPAHDRVRLVIYQDLKGDWRVQSPNIVPSSFELVCPMPKAWRGLSPEALDIEISKLVSNYPSGAVFCHPNGFVAGHASRDGVLAMAQAAIAYNGPW